MGGISAISASLERCTIWSTQSNSVRIGIGCNVGFKCGKPRYAECHPGGDWSRRAQRPVRSQQAETGGDWQNDMRAKWRSCSSLRAEDPAIRNLGEALVPRWEAFLQYWISAESALCRAIRYELESGAMLGLSVETRGTQSAIQAGIGAEGRNDQYALNRPRREGTGKMICEPSGAL